MKVVGSMNSKLGCSFNYLKILKRQSRSKSKMKLRIVSHKPSEATELNGAKENNKFSKLTPAHRIKIRKHLLCNFSKIQN